MDRKDELKERTGKLPRDEGAVRAERESRRDAPPRAGRPHRGGADEPGPPGPARDDEPAERGEQERAAERVARRGAPHDADPPAKPRR